MIQQLFQDFGPSYLARFGDAVPFQHRKVIAAIQNCRSGEYGQCVYTCEDCGEVHLRPRSCGNRHCSQCQHANTQQCFGKLSTSGWRNSYTANCRGITSC